MERLFAELDKLAAEAEDAPPLAAHGFSLAIGMDLEAYLTTELPGSESFRVSFRDETGDLGELPRVPVGEWFTQHRCVEPGESAWDLEGAGEEPWHFVVERPGEAPLEFALSTRSVIG